MQIRTYECSPCRFKYHRFPGHRHLIRAVRFWEFAKGPALLHIDYFDGVEMVDAATGEFITVCGREISH